MSSTGTNTPDMLWEDGGLDSWRAFGVRGQPAWVLLDSNGQILIDRQFGGIDEQEVLDAL